MDETRNKTYFVSDFHLGVDGKQSSSSREKKVVAFLQSIEKDAKRVFLLGDVFDFWYEYKRVIPKGYTRLFGQLSRMTDMGIEVDFFCGNHDLWQRDYFSKELNVSLHREKTKEFTIDGKIFLLGHGDGLDPKDYRYTFIRALFRSKFGNWLFTSLPTNFTLWLAEKWSSLSRHSHAESDLVDKGEKEPIFVFCKQYMEKKHVDFFVFGHRHVTICKHIGEGTIYLNTGAWLYDSPYGVWDGKELSLCRYD